MSQSYPMNVLLSRTRILNLNPTMRKIEKLVTLEDYPSARKGRVLHQATVGREDIGLFRVLPYGIRGFTDAERTLHHKPRTLNIGKKGNTDIQTQRKWPNQCPS